PRCCRSRGSWIARSRNARCRDARASRKACPWAPPRARTARFLRRGKRRRGRTRARASRRRPWAGAASACAAKDETTAGDRSTRFFARYRIEQVAHRLVGPVVRVLVDDRLALGDHIGRDLAPLTEAAPELLDLFRLHFDGT